MANTWYSNIAQEQEPALNFPGGGPIVQGPSGTSAYNDPSLEIGRRFDCTPIYTMTGNEAVNDIINLYLAQPGTMVLPTGTVVNNGIAAAATIAVGDDDTTGTGGSASSTRYSASIDVHATNVTSTPTAFAGGDALLTPYMIGPTATESNSTGVTIAGSWIQAKFLTMTTPVSGKLLVFRLPILKP